ncbi:MAG: SdrD B-like domain-containing protein, partial [Anaerolineae bacterium]
GSTTGTISFTMTRSCSPAPLRTGVQFDNRCAVTYGNTDSNYTAVDGPDIQLFVTPDTYVIKTDQATWRVYAINVGDGTAGRFVITNALGTGLAFYTYTTNLTNNISLLNSAPFTTPGETMVWEVRNLEPGELVRMDIMATLESCTGITSRVMVDSSCLESACASLASDEVNFLRLPVAVRSENDQTADLKLCETGEVILRVKNAALESHIYNMVVTETITFMGYVAGTAVMTIEDKFGDPDPVYRNIPFEPAVTVGATTTLLYWGLDVASNPTQTAMLLDRGPEETIVIRYTVQTSCNTPGENTVQAIAGGDEACGEFFLRSESAETLDSVDPEITLTKGGRNLTKGDVTYVQTVYGEPGDVIEWQVTAINAIGAWIARNVLVTDALPLDLTISSITVTTGAREYITSSHVVSWGIGNLPAIGIDEELLIQTVITTTNVDCSINSVNTATLTYGCNDGCKVVPPKSALATLIKQPSLGLSVPGSTNMNVCGEELYITIQNENGPTAYNVVLTDTLPPGYEYVSGAMSPTAVISPLAGSTVLTWTWNSLPQGDTLITFTVRQTATNGTCNINPSGANQLNLSYQDHPACLVPVTHQEAANTNITFNAPNMEISKLPDFQVDAVGQIITWTVTVTNTGTGDAFNIVVSDTAGSQFENLTHIANTTGATPNFSGTNVITWDVGYLSPNSTWAVTMTAVLTNNGYNRNLAQVTSHCGTSCRTGDIDTEAFVSLLNVFSKTSRIQTGTIGSLVTFDLEAALSDVDGDYENIVITDALPSGLGYVSAVLTYVTDVDGNSGGPTTTATISPSSAPSQYDFGNVVWSLGSSQPGSIGINGVITAVIRDDAASYDGAILANEFQMAYIQDGAPYLFTNTANVDVLEPILHIGKSYTTPYGCNATFDQANFNAGSGGNWPTGAANVNVTADGLLRFTDNGDTTNTVLDVSDFGMSFMARKAVTDSAIFEIRFRRNGANRYSLQWRPNGNIRLQSQNGGSATIGSGASTISLGAWHHFEIRAEGSQIQIYVDGVQQISVTNSDHASGSITFDADAGSVVDIDDVLVTRFGETSCVIAGNDLVTYTLTISNQARLPGYHLVVTDDLPAWMSLVTHTLASNDVPAPAVVAGPSPGATGVLTWRIDHLTPTVPFDPPDHIAITLTVVLSVSTDVPANVVLPNQTSLAYTNWLTNTSPTTVTRYSSGGSHSTAVRTIDGEIGDYVWVDLNRDGVQDIGETPIPGVVIDLYNSTTGTYITSTTTDGGGLYLFENLPLNKTYTVQLSQTNFTPVGALYPYTVTLLHQGASDTDSDANPNAFFNGFGYAVTTTLTFSPIFTQDLTLDFGFYAGRIGDYVWIDHDLDGIQDAGETPVAGVLVDLYDSATKTYLGSDTTAGGGLYLFDDLPLNVTYTVQLSQTNFGPGGALYSYTPTSLTVGSPDTDSDANPNALFNGSGYAVTTTLTTLITEDLTLDFGFYQMDLGDLPESPYPTTLAQNGARHVILPNNNPTMGSTVDAELDGQPNATATGDDIADTPDDEDGVSFTLLVPGQVATVTVTALSVISGGLVGVLNAWLDFDGDGDLTGAGEQIAPNEPLNAGSSIAITFTVPTTVTNTVYSRFRFSSDSNLQP